MRGLGEALKKILRAKTIAVVCHINPDGDCIGSLLALGLGLESLGKRVYLLSADGVPARYRHLPGAGRIKNKFNKQVALAVSVDCGDKALLGPMYKVFETAADSLEVDHHEFRRPFGKASFIDSKAAAVGEMVFVLLERLRIKITEDIAQNILTSLIVETNSFRLPTVRPFTFAACARLMQTGLDFHKLSELIYWSRTKEAAWLLGLCFSRSRLLDGGRIIWSVVFQRDLKKFKAKKEDVDSVANDLLSVKGVEAAVFFREEKRGSLRVSLRSKGGLNVASIAEEYNGGGHFDVAGCQIANQPAARRALLSLVRERLRNFPAR